MIVLALIIEVVVEEGGEVAVPLRLVEDADNGRLLAEGDDDMADVERERGGGRVCRPEGELVRGGGLPLARHDAANRAGLRVDQRREMAGERRCVHQATSRR